MRQGSNPKRLRGRGNGRKHPPRNQNFESNGPEVKVRGNAQQVVERYLALARDASSAGDRITAESYYQHAEHYYRIMTANGAYAANREQPHHDGGPQLDGAPQPDIGPQPDIASQPQPQMAPQGEQRPRQQADPPQEERDSGSGEDGGAEPVPV